MLYFTVQTSVTWEERDTKRLLQSSLDFTKFFNLQMPDFYLRFVDDVKPSAHYSRNMTNFITTDFY